MFLNTAINFNAFFDCCANDNTERKKLNKTNTLYATMHTAILVNV